MHEEWEDYDRKQFLAWWAANSASQIKEIACNAPIQPGRKCCKLLLDEKDNSIWKRNLQDEAFPCKANNCYKYLSLCVCAAEINTFSFLSGLLFAIFFPYLFTVSNRMQFCTISFKFFLPAYLFLGLPFAWYCRSHCWWGAEWDIKLFKKTGDKEMHAICWNLLHMKECCLSPT